MKILSFLFFSFFAFSAFTQNLSEVKYEKIKNNKRLAYYELGSGSETIVFLHGWPQTSYVWRKVMPMFVKEYKVIAIDLPGLGNSDLLEDYSTENISKIIYEFIQQKQLKKVHLVGHDLGSWVALTYGITFESSLETLTLVDAGIPGLMDPSVFQPENANKIWQFYFHNVKDIPEFLVSGKEAEYFNWYFSTKSHVKNAITKEDEKIYVDSYKEKGRMNAGFEYYRAYSQNASFNKSKINTITIPVLAVGGEKALADNVGKGLIKFTKDLKNVSLLGSGHYVPEEQPELFFEVLNQFIHDQKVN